MCKCKICGQKFDPRDSVHYISKDYKEDTCVTSIIKNGNIRYMMEPNNAVQKTYDTFDCPHCGCQVIVQERKPDEEPYKAINMDNPRFENLMSDVGNLEPDTEAFIRAIEEAMKFLNG